MAKTGRRPGANTTRVHILKVARAQFAERGYARTTLRTIASAAGVHPALLHHYFGTKQRLYREALDIPVDPWAVLDRLLTDTPRERFAEEFVRHFVTTWRTPETGIWSRAVVRQAFADPEAMAGLRSLWESIMIPRLSDSLGISEARATATMSVVFGLVLADSFIDARPVTELTDDELVHLFAPIIEQAITST